MLTIAGGIILAILFLTLLSWFFSPPNIPVGLLGIKEARWKKWIEARKIIILAILLIIVSMLRHK